MNFTVTQEEINRYVECGGDFDMLTYDEISKIPKKSINQYVANGGRLTSKIVSIDDSKKLLPQETINQYILNGGILDELGRLAPSYDMDRWSNDDMGYIYPDSEKEKIPQEIVNKIAVSSYQLGWFTDAQIKAIPQDIINQRAANGKSLYMFTEAQKEAIPQEIINQCLASGRGEDLIGSLTVAQRAALSQEVINSYFASGASLSSFENEDIFTVAQIEAIPQDIINQRAANGKSLYMFTEAQKEAIPQEIKDKLLEYGQMEIFSRAEIESLPQEIVNKLVAKVKSIRIFTKSQINSLSQEAINQYFLSSNFEHYNYFTPEQIETIPQEIVNQLVSAGKVRVLEILTKEQKDEIPQEIVNRFASTSIGNEGYLSELFSSAQVVAIPEEIKNGISNKAKKALILYQIGDIESNNLPMEVFVNSAARAALIRIVETKTKKSFNDICVEQGYTDEIPDRVVEAFNDLMKSIFDEIYSLQEQGLKQLESENKKAQGNDTKSLEAKSKRRPEEVIEDTIEKIKGMGW